MGTRSTVKGYWRQGGNSISNIATPAVVPSVLAVAVDPVAATGTATGKTLPKGAIVLGIDVVSGHTAGTTPLLDIGLAAVDDALLNGAAADADLSINVATATTPGVTFGVELVVDAAVTAGTGGGTPGTGTSVAYIRYVMVDDGVINN